MSDFKAKMHKIPISAGVPSRPRWGNLHSAPPDPFTVFKGPTSKGRDGEEWRGRVEERSEGERPGPRYLGLEPPLRETERR